ncbi:sterol-sensing domain of SREBP cleavage-activation-domain-containing protein [Cantharellus anzutake]|uniref:sterol-sensing domain of SREBP cleavage-activation-domain-containing protein n=1 Tax=Cantharellus anzutake TaxID=1750568 RepID=UPI0019075C0A|nr:sterol-sensing domain of SREBP cleavage-activation-domain-containing protein [Cantharellus anzutake]KAF8328925.1 sterol-sensing domain of SREBP cleavage-activation-domain-containing protein [Cantharellus anzutake]
MDRTVSIERLFVQGAYETYGTLDLSVLTASAALQRRIVDEVLRGKNSLPCVQNYRGECFITDPLKSWNFTDFAFLDADEVFRRVNRVPMVDGLPVPAQSLLSGQPQEDDQIEDPDFLTFTYYFHGDDCQNEAKHNAWLKRLQAVGSGMGRIKSSSSAPKLLSIQYDVSDDKSRISLMAVVLYITYAVVFVHFSGSLKRMDTVHSRYGLALTGIVEIIASTLCSVSVCALWGYHITMVPWGILPVVIVLVGAENMFTLIDKVVSTRVTLPVKERLALGLSHAGTFNTFRVVGCNVILGTIGFFAHGATRQFCVFAIVVLVAHWFLVHTMFVAVLAIDLYRLELSELLHQGSKKPSVPNGANGLKRTSLSPVKKRNKVQQFLKSEAATNGSLLLMLAVSATLYYATYSFPDRYDMEPRVTAVAYRMNSTRPAPPTEVVQDVVGRKIWDVLNPEDDPLLFVKIEPPTVIELAISTSQPQAERRHQPRFFASRMTSQLNRLMRIVIFPSVATNFLLYILLRYLQKDPELVAAQGHREDGDRPSKPRTNLVEGNVSFTPLLRACSQNVAMIAYSQDTSIIAAVSDNELAIWFEDGSHLTLDTTSALYSRSQSLGEITSLAVDPSGAYCAIGSSEGILAVWSIFIRSVLFQASALLPGRIRSVRFGYTPNVLTHRTKSKLNLRRPLTLAISVDDGETYIWDFFSSSLPSRGAEAIPQLSSASPREGVKPSMTFYSMRLAGLGVTDTIISVHPQILRVGDVNFPILIIITQNRQVFIFREDSRELAGVVEAQCSVVDQIRVIGLSARECAKCLNDRDSTLVIALGTEEVLKIYHLPCVPEGKLCSCLRHDMLDAHNVVQDGSISRRTSMTFISATSPPTRLQTFPVPLPMASIGSAIDSSRRLRTATKVAEISIERGSWDVCNNLILGVRRRLPAFQPRSSRNELSPSSRPQPKSPFERWELWSLDLYGNLRVSPISELSSHADSSSPRTSRSSSVSELFFHPPPEASMPTQVHSSASTSSTFPRIPFTRAGPFLSVTPSISITSFGNTLGVFRFS